MFRQLSVAAIAAVVLVAMPVASNAQDTTSSIRGNVTAPDGGPAAGVSVRITDTRTGSTSSATTSSSGRFTVGNLAVGGPYTISLTSSNYASQSITDVIVALGESFDFDVTLTAESIEEIIVTAALVQSAQVAIGPASAFSFDDIQNLPSINRDINDIVRVDPRIYIDGGFVNAVTCLGANPRFNSLTVDGVKKNDNFGLNSNGYPTQRMPFPFDSVQNVSVEMAPYAVQYGGFTACNINAVTRAGTNEFHGTAWMSYGDSDLTGDNLEGDSIPQGKYDETRWGVSLGGPVIKDKLFFFAAYEKSDGADTFDGCAGDESCGRPVAGVTRAQLDRIAEIAEDYGYDVGDNPPSLPNEDEKLLLRFDWNINDDHNAVLTYNYNDGFNITESDDDADEYEFSNHYYERGAELNAYSGQLFSDWTENFSTELRIGYSELENRQNTITNQNPLPGPEGFAEMQIETYADVDGDGRMSRAIVYLGGDDSRQANVLNYDTFNLKLEGAWTKGDHIISAGFETEEYDIYNLFIQHNIGEYRFDESNTDINGNPVGCNSSRPDGCIDQFEDFSPDDIYYGNAPSLDPRDGAPSFKYATNTVYLQDEFIVDHLDLSFVVGLRYDWYSSDDLPRENQNFVARNGYSNSQNFDGESLLQPRFGFTWDISNDLSLRGGIGLYSGGNPNVWLSNNYSNDGFSVIQAREFNGGVADLNVNPDRNLTTIPLGVDGNGSPGYDAPQGMIQYVRDSSGNSGVNGIDPNFSIPSNWKASIGALWTFDAGFMGDDYVLNGDIIFSRAKDSAIIRDDTLIPFSTAPDGRPVYFQGDKSVPGCAEDPIGTGLGTCGRRFTSDFILGNVEGDDAESTSIALSLSKEHDFGLSWTLGYAYTEADDVTPMTSSVAFSNWVLIAVDDSNNPSQATANYEIPHRFTLRMSYENEFFGDYATRISLFGQANEGRHYSYTFFEQEMFIRQDFFWGDDDRHLMYMPSGPDDPLVVFDDDFDQDAFFAFAADNDLNQYGGGIVPRNSAEGSWWTKFDLRINQELPGFGEDHRANLYFTIENLGNLLNDDWGVLYERSFPRTAPIVAASYVDVNGTTWDFSDDLYSFNEFIPQTQSRVASPSLWRIRIGFNYNF